MPRRTGPEAEEQAEKAKNARWRYAIRHPEFRAQLRTLSGLLETNSVEYQEKFDALLREWGFQYIGGEIIAGLPYIDSPEEEIEFLEAYSDIVLSFPVLDIETDEEHVLLLKIDLNNPLDLIQALVENELRSAIEYREERSRGRRRLDKVDFYLEVYTRARRGERFSEIASSLGQNLSTVKSAFQAAIRNIFGTAAALAKKDITLAEFDPFKHFEQCSVCKAAQDFEQMCAQTRLFAIQDHHGQREAAGHDTTR